MKRIFIISIWATLQIFAEESNPAVIPVPKLEQDGYDWHARHADVLRIKKTLNPEIVLLGDSITHFWGGEPKAHTIRGPKAWESVFAGKRVLNLGYGWDRTQNVLWRIDHGELDGISPEYVVIHIGTNNTSGTPNARENTAEEIAAGVREVCERVKAKLPKTKILLMAIFPREELPDHPRRLLIGKSNQLIAADAKKLGISWIDIGPSLLESDGKLSRLMMPDFCHPGETAYQVWADALKENFDK